MAIRIKHSNLVYFPVPKIACTSIKLAIMQHHDRARYAALASDDHVHGKYGGYRSLPWALEWRHYIDRVMPFTWMRAFCVVRDPIDRFVSGYRNRILHWQELGKNPPDINQFALDLAVYCRADPQIRHHFQPMTVYLGNDPSFYDRVFRMSELSSVPAYCGLLGELPRTQADGPPISRSELSDGALRRLMQFYGVDYRVWREYLAPASSAQ